MDLEALALAVDDRIRVNIVHPGGIDTVMIRPEGLGGFTDEAQAEAFGMTPIPRVGQPEEVAKLALFLASDESSYFTGEILHPDGGFFTE